MRARRSFGACLHGVAQAYFNRPSLAAGEITRRGRRRAWGYCWELASPAGTLWNPKGATITSGKSKLKPT